MHTRLQTHGRTTFREDPLKLLLLVCILHCIVSYFTCATEDTMSGYSVEPRNESLSKPSDRPRMSPSQTSRSLLSESSRLIEPSDPLLPPARGGPVAPSSRPAARIPSMSGLWARSSQMSAAEAPYIRRKQKWRGRLEEGLGRPDQERGVRVYDSKMACEGTRLPRMVCFPSSYTTGSGAVTRTSYKISYNCSVGSLLRDGGITE